MPLFRLTTEKYYNGEYWTNIYWLSGADIVSLVGDANSIVAAERAVTVSSVTFTKYRIDDGLPDTDMYQTAILNVLGTRAFASDPAPLFVTARVDFPVALSSPSRKYLRGVFIETDLNAFGAVQEATVTFVNTNYGTPLGAIASYVDVDGSDLGAGKLWPFANVRQLRRGSKKKTTP